MEGYQRNANEMENIEVDDESLSDGMERQQYT
jgi:hypothetical protein